MISESNRWLEVEDFGAPLVLAVHSQMAFPMSSQSDVLLDVGSIDESAICRSHVNEYTVHDV